MRQKKAYYCFLQEEDSNVHKLYIYDDVKKYGDFNWQEWKYEESETSSNFFKKRLEEIKESDTIEIHINSNGGSVKEGIAIYNLLKQKKCKEIIAYVDGFAYSIASVILQAADKRIMGLGSSLLIHNMWIAIEGNAKELRKAADDLDVLMDANRKVYLEKAKISEEELIEMLDKETYLTAHDAVKYGFADEVYENTQANKQDIENELLQQLKETKQALKEKKALRDVFVAYAKSAEDCKPQQEKKKGNYKHLLIKAAQNHLEEEKKDEE